MRRRDFLVGSLIAPSLATRVTAQPKDRVKRILLIGPAWSESAWAILVGELREFGLVEGANLFVSRRDMKERTWPEVLEEIRRTPPDLIATNSVTWARRLAAVNGTIPILIAALSPVEHGLVASLARPDGNVTGIAIDVGPDLFGKQLDLLLDVAPDASHVACLGADTAYPGMRQLWSEGNRRGVGVQEFSCPDRYEPVFIAMVREGAKAVLVLPETKHVLYARTVADLAKQHRLPLISPFRRLTEAGGLLSYGVDWNEIDRRLATYATRILNGTRPSELPWEQPSKFELLLNRQAAEYLGLSFPPSLLARADEVIE